MFNIPADSTPEEATDLNKINNELPSTSEYR